MNTIEQNYLHKELDMLGKIDKYKAEIKAMRKDCEELHRIKSEQVSFFSNDESKILRTEKADEGGMQ